VTTITHDEWQDISIALPPGAGARRLRIDLMHAPEFVEIAALRVRTSTREYFSATRKEDFDRITIAGDAERVADAEVLRLRISGIDPQLVLPELEAEPADEPLRVELRLHLR
ncbi:MAG TPA: hypothetical protein VGF73_13080, partial [Chthoniobacterales bacterium]